MALDRSRREGAQRARRHARARSHRSMSRALEEASPPPPACIDRTPACSSYVQFQSCNATVNDLRSVNGIASVLHWYWAPPPAAALRGYTTVRSYCCASCDGAHSAMAPLAARVLTSRHVGDSDVSVASAADLDHPSRIGVVMPLHRPKYQNAVHFARSLVACGQA